MTWNATRRDELAEKIADGQRLSYQDGVDLYECDDLAWLGAQAHGVRTKKNGDAVFFNVNRHLNLTNVCRASCAYCSLSASPAPRTRTRCGWKRPSSWRRP
jgi:aminodeoxyfutalosine synthase